MHDDLTGYDPREALREALGLAYATKNLAKEINEAVVMRDIISRIEYVLDNATIYKKMED